MQEKIVQERKDTPESRTTRSVGSGYSTLLLPV